MKARFREHVVGVALAGAAVAGLVWYALAMATGLIYHFMPAAPTLVAAWVVRWADDEALGRTQRTAVLTAGAILAVGMSLVLAGEGRPLDEPVITGLAIMAGVLIGAWLLRPARRSAGRSETRQQNVGHHTVE